MKNTIGTHATAIHTDDNGYTNVVYHSTPVVKFNGARIILNTGGYYSNTTKKRMNETSQEFNLGFHVAAIRGKWHVMHNHSDALRNRQGAQS